MDPEERAILTATLGRLATAFDGVELTKALDDFGIREVLAGSPREAVSGLFAAMGRAGSMAAALQDVLAIHLPGAAGHSVVLPFMGRSRVGTFERGAVTMRGLVVGGHTADALLVPVDSAGETVWVRPLEPMTSRVISGLDPELRLTEVTAFACRAEVTLDGRAAAESRQAVVAAARRALGYQIVGAAGRMIELAVDHARDRRQFGRPIGSFQAVRHRLADAHVAREGAAAALDAAWDADDEELAAMLAKSLAGRAARIAATQCQQVLAGVGFTAEHPFHRFLARTVVLDRIAGSATELPGLIGARIAATGAIPRLVEL
jgi:hypothetical protein